MRCLKLFTTHLINATRAIMKLDLLQLFVDVARAGGFAPVARARDLAPSSVSRAIAALEADLGVSLLTRTTRQVALTEAGDILLKRGEALLEDAEALTEALSALNETPRGTLRITASVAFAESVVVPRLVRFRAVHPGISLELHPSDRSLDLVAERLDLAIRHGPLPDSSLRVRKVSEARYLVVASPEYIEERSIETPDDLESADHLCLTYGGHAEAWVFERENETRTQAVRPVLKTSSPLALRQAAMTGLGVALLADWCVADALEAGTLVRVLPDWNVRALGAEATSPIWLASPERSYVPRKVQAFTDFLTAALRS